MKNIHKHPLILLQFLQKLKLMIIYLIKEQNNKNNNNLLLVFEIVAVVILDQDSNKSKTFNVCGFFKRID